MAWWRETVDIVLHRTHTHTRHTLPIDGRSQAGFASDRGTVRRTEFFPSPDCSRFLREASIITWNALSTCVCEDRVLRSFSLNITIIIISALGTVLFRNCTQYGHKIYGKLVLRVFLSRLLLFKTNWIFSRCFYYTFLGGRVVRRYPTVAIV